MGNLKPWTESLKKHTENIWDLDNKERCLYIYFLVGNSYNLSNSIMVKKPFVVTVLPVAYPYINSLLYKSQIAYKDPFSTYLYLATPTTPRHPPLCPAEKLLLKTTQKPNCLTHWAHPSHPLAKLCHLIHLHLP